jgi:hypothetical protein
MATMTTTSTFVKRGHDDGCGYGPDLVWFTSEFREQNGGYNKAYGHGARKRKKAYYAPRVIAEKIRSNIVFMDTRTGELVGIPSRGGAEPDFYQAVRYVGPPSRDDMISWATIFLKLGPADASIAVKDGLLILSAQTRRVVEDCWERDNGRKSARVQAARTEKQRIKRENALKRARANIRQERERLLGERWSKLRAPRTYFGRH